MFLNQLRERALEAGVQSVDMRQRHGALEETLIEQENGVRLLVLGRRGESAEHTKRQLGRNVERVVRAVHKPILTVTEGFKAPERVMIAFNGGIVTRRGVKLIASSPLFRGLPIHLLMSGKQTQEAVKQLDWAQTTLQEAGFETIVSLVAGDAETVIARKVNDESIDLLIMGAYSHSALHTMLFGSKTADLLRSFTIPTLLLR